MKLVYLFLLLLCFQSLVAQQFIEKGSPFIHNYSEKEYKGQSQNWDIVEDRYGMMYFANNGGVLEFDGVDWNLIKMPNRSVVRSLAIDSNNVVYVGAVDEFGYLKPDAHGKLIYQSLSAQLDTSHQNFKSVWKTYATTHGVYFYTDTYLIRWHKNAFHFWYPKKQKFFLSFQIGDEVYVYEKNIGLLYINDEDSLLPFSNQQKLIDARIFQMMPYQNEEILVCSPLEGIFIMSIEKNQELNIRKPENSAATDYFLTDNQIYHGAKIDENHFVISTLRDGIVVINEKGEILEHFNEKKGLSNDQVWAVYVDQKKNIWCGLNAGISLIEWNVPIRFFNQSLGIKGTVLDIVRYKNIIFTATSQGLFYYKNNRFQDYGTFKRHNWDLFIFQKNAAIDQKKLLLASTFGVYEVRVNNEKITHQKIAGIGKNCYYLYQSEKFPSLLFLGFNDGMGVLQFKNGKFIQLYMIPGITEQIRLIEEDNEHNLWLQTAYNGVIRIDFEHKAIEEKIEQIERIDLKIDKYTTASGLPHSKDVNICNHYNKLYFTTEKGLYSFNKEKEIFAPDTSLGKALADGSFGIYRFLPDEKGNFWITSNPFKPYSEILIKKGDQYERDTFSLKRIPYMDGQSLYHDKNGISWIGGTEGLYAVDYTKKSDKESFNTLIRKVIVNNDSVIYPKKKNIDKEKALNTAEDLSFCFKNNSIIFHFASLYYSPAQENTYSYYLEGFRNSKNRWSDWTKETKKEYTNLSEGTYLFHVKSKNIYGAMSTTDTFSFTILPPWYRTWFAYIGYLVFLSLFVYAAILLNSKRLKNINRKLEKEVLKRTFEIEQQKEEIKAQAEQLASINKELEKLSIVASKTRNAIIIMDKAGNIEWINDAFTRMYGYTIDDVKQSGTNIKEVSNHPNIKILFDSWLGNKMPLYFETLNKTKDGKNVWAQTTISPVLDNEKNIIKLVAIDADITELKETDELLKQKNADMTDSIAYASRIQHAILPNYDHMEQYVQDSFLIYMPKDIVSGDFYWYSLVENKLILAVADCTGHGVPGAFMSMIGVVFLNKIVNEKSITSPDEILNRLRTNVTNALHKTGKPEESFDGMDISIIQINLDTYEMHYAGAMNPAYIIRGKELIEFAPDKMPIGIYEIMNKSFSKKEYRLQKGDCIYLFTDGYVDQFGGKNEQKFMYNKFKKLINKISHHNMKDQSERLIQEYYAWKGDIEQIDDILIIGLKI